MTEGKAYYIGKPKFYGYKPEILFLPIALSINCTINYPGSVSDWEKFSKKSSFSSGGCKMKWVLKAEYTDVGVLSAKYEHPWAFLLDKGYEGVKSFL